MRKHADFRFDSRIADGTAMAVTARVQRCVAVLMPVFEIRQHGGLPIQRSANVGHVADARISVPEQSSVANLSAANSVHCEVA